MIEQTHYITITILSATTLIDVMAEIMTLQVAKFICRRAEKQGQECRRSSRSAYQIQAGYHRTEH